MQYRDIAAPKVPVVFCCTAASAASALGLPRDVVGVVNRYDWSKTLDLAERLQPNAHKLAVISGASDYDREWLEDLRRELASRIDRYEVRYLTGLTYDRFAREVAKLPRDTIVLLAPVFTDRSGKIPPAAGGRGGNRSSVRSAGLFAYRYILWQRYRRRIHG